MLQIVAEMCKTNKTEKVIIDKIPEKLLKCSIKMKYRKNEKINLKKAVKVYFFLVFIFNFNFSFSFQSEAISKKNKVFN